MTTPSGMPFRWALAQPIGIVERDGITYVATFPTARSSCSIRWRRPSWRSRSTSRPTR